MAAMQTNFRGRLSFVLKNYGTILVLLALVVLFSRATIATQYPEGSEAVRQVADLIVEAAGTEARVFVAFPASDADKLMAQSLASTLQDRGVEVVGVIAGRPSDVRSAVQTLLDQGQKIDAVGCSGISAGWPFWERMPEIGVQRCYSPRPYDWPNFLKFSNILVILDQAAISAIVAIGMTMVVITGGIDLSVGSLVALSAVVSTLLIQNYGQGTSASVGFVIMAMTAAVLLTTAMGLMNGVLVTIGKLPPFIATLAMMMIASGIAFRISDGGSFDQVPAVFKSPGGTIGIKVPGTEFSFGLPMPIVVMVCLYVMAHCVMKYSVVGRILYAIGGNREGARLAGIRVRWSLILTYAIAGTLSGVSGILLASKLGAGNPTFGLMYEMEVIAAVVVGGTSLMGGEGRVLGTLTGAIMIAVIGNGMNLIGLGSFDQKIALGVILLVACLLDRSRA
ncbi:MAG: ABC transporter permease [Planctomyces sp.]|nr:ABC transporter permease [Planctomyces sp.]